MALGWMELVIIAGLGCGCVALPLAAAIVILLLIRKGKKQPAHPPA